MPSQKRPTVPPAKRRGFSLIELLVVISIIALLISITVPALSKAKAQASTVVCKTRISALLTATHVYLSEWDNTFPINGLIMPKSQGPPNTKFAPFEVNDPQKWRLEYGALFPYMHGTTPLPNAQFPLPPTDPIVQKAYLCPDDDLVRTSDKTAPAQAPLTMQINGRQSTVHIGGGTGGYWSYSVNSVLNPLGRVRLNFPNNQPPWIDPLKFTTILNPSNFIIFVEEDDSSLFNDEVFDPPAYNNGDKLTNRHNNGGNVGFGDGHVEWISEVEFNHGGSSTSTGPVDNWTAMQSPYTRMFFPDGGGFAHP
ncbi:MAG TPA: prepilin-type N-terminal cleavage/methylation domain-containing protein [Phycisphaerae bacterium]|nr:prepilin-type N-terminal cleavage/methylation domain-containing protein [Phycisphaerae bacterium]